MTIENLHAQSNKEFFQEISWELHNLKDKVKKKTKNEGIDKNDKRKTKKEETSKKMINNLKPEENDMFDRLKNKPKKVSRTRTKTLTYNIWWVKTFETNAEWKRITKIKEWSWLYVDKATFDLYQDYMDWATKENWRNTQKFLKGNVD